MADPDKVTDRFLDAVKAIDEQGMKTMPCLFNRSRRKVGLRRAVHRRPLSRLCPQAGLRSDIGEAAGGRPSRVGMGPLQRTAEQPG